MQAMPPQSPESHESSTKPCLCGFPHGVYDGLCGTCYTRRRWAEDKAAAAKARDEVENAKVMAQMEQEIGAQAIRDWTLENFKAYDDVTDKALREAQAFHPTTSSLYLFGVTGSGKTHLAVALAVKWRLAGYSMRFFVSGDKFARYLRFREPDEEDRRVEDMASADVLVVNELGLGANSEKAIQSLTEVLDRRIMKGRRGGFIVSSNFDPQGLAVQFKETRIESRIVGMCKIIEAGREDYRKQHRKA